MSEEATPESVATETVPSVTAPEQSAPEQVGDVPSVTGDQVPVKEGASWKDKYPDEMRNHPSFGKFKDESEIFKSYVNLESMMGTEKIPKLKADATPEERLTYLKDHGLANPVTGDENYEFKFDNISDDLKEDFEKLGSKINEVGKKYGLDKNGFESAINEVLESQSQEYEQAAQDVLKQRGQEMAELKEELGKSFDYKLNLAKYAVTKLDEVTNGEISKILNSKALGYLNSSKPMVEALMHVGEVLGGQKSDSVNTGSLEPEFTMSPSQAQAEMKKLSAEPGFMNKFTNNVPGHTELMARWNKLSEIVAQGQS